MISTTGGESVKAATAVAALPRVGWAALTLALGLQACHRAETVSAPPAGEHLKVEMGKATKLDPDAALRCFVHGQFVGMQTPPECARRNGVAPGALDVGLDQSGALAAGAGDTHLQPLANATSEDNAADDNSVDDSDTPDQPSNTPSPLAAATPRPTDPHTGDCLKFGRAGWRGAAQAVGLGVCARVLFNGQCVAPGQAVYGRWGGETLRLLPGRVDMSDNNRDFHPLMAQDAQNCVLAPL